MLKSTRMQMIAVVGTLVSVFGASAMSAQQDKYTLKVPGGLAFSEFRGYEGWHLVSVSQDGGLFAAILANPVMIKAYEAGFPGNGKPFPDGPGWRRSIGRQRRARRPPLRQRCRTPCMTSILW